MSQTQQIFEYMQQHGAITPLEALSFCKCFRLASRINELKHQGADIQVHMVSNNGKRYASYSLVKDKQLLLF